MSSKTGKEVFCGREVLCTKGLGGKSVPECEASIWKPLKIPALMYESSKALDVV